VRIDAPVNASTDGGWSFPAPVVASPTVNVSWRVLGNAVAFELSIEGVPSSLVKTDQLHGVLDFSQLPNACWVIKVHAVSPSAGARPVLATAAASSSASSSSSQQQQQPAVPITNASCQRYWGDDFGSNDYLAVQLQRA